MIGFLRKDLYSVFCMYRKNLLLVLTLYAVLTIVTQVTFLLYMLVWLMGFYSLSLISLDQASGWDRFAKTLPARPAQIIGARFLTALFLMLMAAGFSLLMGVAAWMVHGPGLEILSFNGDEAFSMGELLFTIPVISAVALACMGLLLPAAYQWGVEKARSTFIVFFMVVFIIPAVFGEQLKERISLEQVGTWLDAQPYPVLLAIFLGAALVIYALGFGLSCHVYAQKEF